MPISIVLPTYNGVKYLEQAIQSVQAQIYDDWELIISDDGSNDGTRDFLSAIRDRRVKVHFQPKNLGIFGNLNFLFSLAGHEITQILCQDDYFVDSGALDRLLHQWSLLPHDIAFLRCNHSLDVQSNLERYQASILPPIVRPDDSDLFFFTFGCIAGSLSNMSVRTIAVKNAGWFRTDLPYAGDFEFWSRLGRSRPWAIAEIPVTHVRRHMEQASMTLNKSGELLPQVRSVVESLYRPLVSRGYSPALLRLMAAVTYTSQQRDRGMKDLIGGRGTGYLRRVGREFDSSGFSFGRTLDWLIYFACLGGRMFTVPVAKQLLRTHHRISSV